MSQKTKNIIGWTLTTLLAVVLLGSAGMKLVGGEAMKGAAAFGLDGSTVKMIGVVELISIILFIIPRTGVLGTLLLAAYLGGAIATHVEHALPVYGPVIIECVVWITAALRFPELTQRLMNRSRI